MIRSLYSGISGLRTHQVGLDVTANNIANVNTIAFKAGRATFKESMAQLLQGPARPAGNQGGRNPMQIGLGVAVGSIDTMLRQGNLQTTGQITDLAIEGRAYFAFSSGGSTFYSRNGGLQMDSHGYLVSPTNGYRLQGKQANTSGVYTGNEVLGDIRIPWGDKSPAKATDYVALQCNLNSDSQALGTVVHTNRFLIQAGILETGTSANNPSFQAYDRAKLNDLFDVNGNSLGIQEGDVITFGLADPNMPTFKFAVEKRDLLNNGIKEMPNVNELKQGVEAYLNAIEAMHLSANAAILNGSMEDKRAFVNNYIDTYTGGGTVSVGIDPVNGGFTVNNGGTNDITGLHAKSSRPGSNSYVANAFLFPRNIADGTSVTTPGLRIPASETDLLSNLLDAAGVSLGFTDGDTIDINGIVGKRSKETLTLVYNSTTTTMQELMDSLQQALSLPPTDGTFYNRDSISIKSSADLVNDGIPVGSIVIRGQAELAFALDSVSAIAHPADPNQENNPARFSSNMIVTPVQDARNVGVWPTSDVVFDDSGAPHNILMKFTHTGIPGEWLWEIETVGGDEVILGGNRGRVTFALDGTPSSFTFADGSSSFRFDPRNGAAEVDITIDAGKPGSREGITQFHAESTTALTGQNGYTMGKLSEISISDNGEITGLYTNHTSKSIAMIYVAEFNNPAGLMKMGDSMFAVSGNSGEAAMYRPMVGSTSKVKPGALEMSNVELETEFTNMITIQRGYQASARVVSTSDQMLQELVQLVR